MTWLEDPQRAEEFGVNDEFGESDHDKSDELFRQGCWQNYTSE